MRWVQKISCYFSLTPVQVGFTHFPGSSDMAVFRSAKIITALFFLTIAILAPQLQAANFTVTSNADSTTAGTLREALMNAQAGDTITLASNLAGQTISLTEALPMIQGVSIFGPPGGTTINGGGVNPGFFVYSGDSAITNFTISNCVSLGGNGGDGGAGGGGALGAGAGLFVNSGTSVTLQNVNFINNISVGGSGGQAVSGELSGGGGGGGFGSHGGNGIPEGCGGGGGGLFNSPGGASTVLEGSGGGGGGLYSSGGGKGLRGGGGGGGILHSGGGDGGFYEGTPMNKSGAGGGGGGVNFSPGGGGEGLISGNPALGGAGGGGTPGGMGLIDGANATIGGGGGGGGVLNKAGGGDGGSSTAQGGGGGCGYDNSAIGGNASIGGGGGGNALGGTSQVIGGGGGAYTTGGDGAFWSGGGGASSTGGDGGLDAHGNFGGGGGAGFDNAQGTGGFGAGEGGHAGLAGGNGSGFGGGIFVRNGGSLTIIDGTLAGNGVAAGGVGAFADGADAYLMNATHLTYDITQPETTTNLFIGGFDNISTYGMGIGGSITKQGAGALVLKAATSNSYNGHLTINNGILEIGSAFNSDATLNSGKLLINGVLNNVIVNGGVLGGHGAANNIHMKGGVLSPGNQSPGTLFANSLSQDAGTSTFIDITPTGQSDAINVTGAASIAGSLEAIPAPGSYFRGQTYTFLTADGGVTGTYTDVSALGVSISPLYQPNSIQLFVNENSIIPSIPLHGNAEVMRNHLESLTLTPDLITVVQALDVHDPIMLAAQLNLLHPTYYSVLAWNAATTLNSIGTVIDENIFSRYQNNCCYNDCNSTPSHAWLSGIGNYLQQDHIGELPGFCSVNGGIVGGYDRTLSNQLTLGLLGGYVYSYINWHGLSGHSHVHNYYVGPYAAWNCGNLILDGTVIGSWERFATERHVRFGSIDRRAKSTHHARSLMAHIGVTYDYCWNNFNLRPYLSADYIYINEDDFKERGAEGLNLEIKNHKTDFLFGEIGGTLTRNYCLCGYDVTPTVGLGLQTIFPIAGKNFYKTRLIKYDPYFTVTTTNQPLYQIVPSFALEFKKECLPAITLMYHGSYGSKRQDSSFAAIADWTF